MSTFLDVPPARLGVFGRAEFADFPHEQVVFRHDRVSGLRAIVAVHSLALGPAIGGCRMYPYVDEDAALTDVLRLSQGMTFKNAAAGLAHGGAKAVIIGDPRTDKTPELLEAFGRVVEELGGRYITAGDVGTNSDDMDVIGRTTSHVAFRTSAAGGSGDSGPNTAFGVFQAMRAGAQAQWGTSSLAGRTVGVEGLGKVGHHLVALLVDAGATVLASEPDARAVERTRSAWPQVQIVPDVLTAPIDVYAPCAMGGTLGEATAERLSARLVCGGANNQLTVPAIERVLAGRGIVWVPDYLASAGGVVQAAVEVEGGDAAQARRRVESIYDSTLMVIERAAARGISTAAAADDLALERVHAAEQPGPSGQSGRSRRAVHAGVGATAPR